MRGTRITYKSKGHNKDGDNRANLSSIKKEISKKDLSKAFSDPKMVFMKITDHEIYGVNKLKFKRKNFLFLEANPVTFYFSLAGDVVHQLTEAKSHLSHVLKAELSGIDTRNAKAVAFSYIFKVGSVGVIFSFLALEAFLNQQLPEYSLIKHRGKMVSRDVIQRQARFAEKLNIIIPQLDGRNFCELYPRKAKVIDKLKNLRDELTHLKQKRTDGMTVYDSV
jgi:hypothetical protein